MLIRAEEQLVHCKICACVAERPAVLKKYEVLCCPRCGHQLSLRPPNLQMTWALLLAAAVLYLPANLMPVMSVYLLGKGQPDTIIGGVIHLLKAGQWPLALLIFVASLVVPLLKLITLSYLLISIQRGDSQRPHERMRLFYLTEYIGRWSMVDVFVVAILSGLVQFGNLAHIEANAGTFCFAAVVVLTMLAAASLDERLIWASVDKNNA